VGVGVEKPPELRATVTSVVEMAKERGILTVCCGSAAESGPGSRPISLAGPANSVVRGISLLKTRQPHRRL